MYPCLSDCIYFRTIFSFWITHALVLFSAVKRITELIFDAGHVESSTSTKLQFIDIEWLAHAYSLKGVHLPDPNGRSQHPAHEEELPLVILEHCMQQRLKVTGRKHGHALLDRLLEA